MIHCVHKGYPKISIFSEVLLLCCLCKNISYNFMRLTIFCLKHLYSKTLDVSTTNKETSTKETLLEILTDSELSFDQHISSICSKASKKLHALGRIASFMSFNKRRTLMKAFIESQFNYCPLIWIYYSRTMDIKINRIHKRALRLVYSDHVSSFWKHC